MFQRATPSSQCVSSFSPTAAIAAVRSSELEGSRRAAATACSSSAEVTAALSSQSAWADATKGCMYL
eukprot:CAMPEP_0180109378 /NCGR_PEP_ID=MMETSP0985-20121206/34435_1 /TAXON_ID=483367 /ORGANISM="non described non described, Strain CCMP 2436" /LENGTH=66 /DNA_ID=CAMNT_0022047247 /DNA_START=302 /DNA_END=502 /DNA_ORIENTATION=-